MYNYLYFLILGFFGSRICASDIVFRIIPNYELMSIGLARLIFGFTFTQLFLSGTIVLLSPLISKGFGAGDLKLVAILVLGNRSALESLNSLLTSCVLALIWAIIESVGFQKSTSFRDVTIPMAPALVIGFGLFAM